MKLKAILGFLDRSRLLDHVLNGLNSTKVRQVVDERLRIWAISSAHKVGKELMVSGVGLPPIIRGPC